MKKIFFTTILIISISSNMNAEVTVAFYKKNYSSIESMKSYIIGVGKGVFWSNSTLPILGKEKLFCQHDIVLKGDDYINILNKELKVNKNINDASPIEMALTLGIVRTFPCK